MIPRYCMIKDTFSHQEVPYNMYKTEEAQAIAVDDAGNISRADLYCVWGNTLLPCLLAVDEKQLSPAVMTTKDRDVQGHYLNRHALDGKISPLLFFKSIGWPIYRLRVQLQMAKGLFELCHANAYSDVPFVYGPGCDVSPSQHAVGVRLEVFLRDRFVALAANPTGRLRPVFINCEGSVCYEDPNTLFKMNKDQVKVSLDLVKDFIAQTEVDASKIIVISPYKANIEYITAQRQLPEYSALSKMQPAVTVEPSQGREGDIVIIVMGTTAASGPGFTTDEQRLNVMLSRQRSGLVIVGDFHAPCRMEQVKVKERSKLATTREGLFSLMSVCCTGCTRRCGTPADV